MGEPMAMREKYWLKNVSELKQVVKPRADRIDLGKTLLTDQL